MDAVPSLSAKLRNATAQSHQDIETQMDLFRLGLSVAQYAGLLQRWLSFYVAWEPAAAIQLSAPDGFFRRRSKIDLLKRDLIACRIEPLKMKCDLGLIAPRNAATALGTLYVSEGSTLGAQIISKSIEKLLGFTAENGGSFYAGYGPSTMAMWSETKQFIDSVNHGMADDAVTAAIATFRFLGNWLGQAEP